MLLQRLRPVIDAVDVVKNGDVVGDRVGWRPLLRIGEADRSEQRKLCFLASFAGDVICPPVRLCCSAFHSGSPSFGGCRAG